MQASEPGLRLTGPLLCSQFCLCMAEAILLFSPEHSLFFFCSRKARIRLHWAGQTLAILCAALGLGFIKSAEPHPCSAYSLVQREEIKYVRMGVASVAVVRRLTWQGFPLLNSKPI